MSKTVWKNLAAGLFAFGAIVGCQSEQTLGPVPEESATTTGSAIADNAGAIRPGLGNVYTATNQVGSNEIIRYHRSSDGQLTEVGRIATGGSGTGAGLGNQSGIVLTPDNRWLLAVNAGSNDVSLFRVHRGMLELADTEPSGGTLPISVTVHGNLAFVLNGGVPNNIQGFQITAGGDLVPIAGSARALSADDTGPAQIAFSPNGQFLVVTEKATNSIVTYAMTGGGTTSDANVQASNGMTPFGFSFNRQGALIVSEAFGGAADASAVSSYDIMPDGTLSTIDASIPTNQTAACWIIVSQNNRYAWTTNTGSGSLTGYSVSPSGSITRLQKDGRSGDSGAGSGPIDVAQSRRGHYVYSLEAGTHTIGMFQVENDGSLTSLGEISGLPVGTNGLAAF